jgi:type IV pilus assembly protein PilB
MILHCGPTGSGKSMTLYSALNEINTPDIVIRTAEDPIEYTLPGLN